ncbi:unnamed protein product [Brassicogethes aeneus]|uniref:Uncharacterized protein n=1 Tax=Brassicogethes aeneus TaxID=1431903 RepID=A0A9P0FFW8_BRAAE|nr:unnamed protein product [Brassicogethes aeneus]
MLKLLVCSFLCIAALEIGLSQQQTQSGSTLLAQHFSNRCREYSSNGQIYDQIRVDTEELKRYAKYAFGFLPSKKDHFCQKELPHLIGRERQITKNLGECLPESEKFIPAFFDGIFENFLKFLCDGGGENIDNFFSSHGDECRNQLKEVGAESCLEKIFSPVGSSIRKTEMCDDIAVVKKCFSQNLERKCPGFKAFNTLNNRLFNFIEKPCSTSGSRASVPFFLTIIAIFLVTRF